jgi:hypothetical protein
MAGEVDGRAAPLAQTDLEAGEPDRSAPEEHPEQVSALLLSLLAEL